MKRATWCVAAVAAAVLGLPCISVANHIDFLADGPFTLVSTGAPVSGSQLGSPTNILGAEREVDLSLAGGSGFFAAALNPPAPLLSVNSVSSLNKLTLTYDGVGAAGLGGLDFDTLYNFIQVDLSAIVGTGDLSVSVTDSSNNTGTISGPVAVAGTYSFPFAAAGYTGVDFSSVDSVVVMLTTTGAASDFAISSITREASPGDFTVPEPATLFVAMVGMAGSLAFVRRSRS